MHQHLRRGPATGRQLRQQLELLVEAAIDLLDELDGDADFELSECDEDSDEDQDTVPAKAS